MCAAVKTPFAASSPSTVTSFPTKSGAEYVPSARTVVASTVTRRWCASEQRRYYRLSRNRSVERVRSDLDGPEYTGWSRHRRPRAHRCGALRGDHRMPNRLRECRRSNRGYDERCGECANVHPTRPFDLRPQCKPSTVTAPSTGTYTLPFATSGETSAPPIHCVPDACVHVPAVPLNNVVPMLSALKAKSEMLPPPFPGVCNAQTIALPAVVPFDDTTGCEPLSRHSRHPTFAELCTVSAVGDVS
jgi:hypothetical protein